MANHKILETTITRRTYPRRKPWYEAIIAGTRVELQADTREAALTAAKDYALSALHNIEEMPVVIPVPSYKGKVIVVFPRGNSWAYGFFDAKEPAVATRWASGLCLGGGREEVIASAVRHARQLENLPEGDT